MAHWINTSMPATISISSGNDNSSWDSWVVPATTLSSPYPGWGSKLETKPKTSLDLLDDKINEIRAKARQN